ANRPAAGAVGDGPAQLTVTPTSIPHPAGYEDDVASQHLPATLTGPDTLTVAFNPGYLLDALNTLDTPEVHFHLLGPGQRALLTDGPTPTHRHLLMSVKPLV
ncbi:DNA polymerase III subunit beta, partial [Streptomyces sp. NPDC057674]